MQTYPMRFRRRFRNSLRIILFDYDPSRAHEVAERLLEGAHGCRDDVVFAEIITPWFRLLLCPGFRNFGERQFPREVMVAEQTTCRQVIWV